VNEKVIMKRLRILLMLAGFALVLAACGTASSNADDVTESPNAEGLTVVVTTTVWGDIVSEVAGDSAIVEVLYPVGADPHDYQLSSSQVASMQEADLVVVNGLQLEVGILDVIESIEADGANILEVAPLLDPIAFGAGGGECEPDAGHNHDEEGDRAHEEGSCDPHIWMDPLRVATAVELIAGELAALDPSVDWTANAMAYAHELRTLDEEVIAMLEVVSQDRRKMVTNHEALGYFADRYSFEVVGVVIPGGSTLADPSSAELAELVEIMTEENIDVIFGETVDPSALGDAIAAEVGTDVVVVELFTGSLGGPGSGAETYIDMVRTNAVLISEALS
jgi:zinc/manganese transport system substrate-binding protein